MDRTAHNLAPTPEGSKALRRNFLWMTWSGSISIANSLLVWVFMARLRDVEDVGRFTIVMGIYSLFYSIVSLGLLPYLVNEITRRRSMGSGSDRATASFVTSAHVLLLISGTVSAILMMACGFIVSSSWEVQIATLVISLAMIPTGPGAVCEATAIADGRGRIIAATSTVENVLRTVIPLALIWNGYGLIAICSSFAGIRFVSVSIYLLFSSVKISEFTFSYADFRRIALVCPTFAATVIASSINWQAPIFLLGIASTEIESAEFGAASRFMIPVTILMASYANTIQPMLTKNREGSREGFGKYILKMASYPVIGACVIAIGSLLFSGAAVTMLYGEKYRIAAPVLEILALSVIPFCLIMVIARGLIALNSPRVDLGGNILGVIVCLVTGVLLIPRYGAVGAAASQFLSFLAIAIFESSYLWRKISSVRVWRGASFSSASLVMIYLFLWNY